MSGNNMDSDTKSLLISIVGSIIGALAIYYIFIKPAVQLQQYQRQPTQTVNSMNTYENDEVWELNRNSDGRIANLRVARHANVSDSNRPSIIYKPLEPSPIYNSPINPMDKRIDVDQLTEMIQQRLQKRYMELNKKQSDLYRQQRFRMM